MIEEMFFKCLLDVFWPVLPRDIFRNPIKSLWWSIFCKHSLQFSAFNYFCKKAPSWMFKWFLNSPWAIMSEVYLEHSQKSMVERFSENS